MVSKPRATTLRALNYSPAIEAFLAKAKKRRCELLGVLAPIMGRAYGTVFTRQDCERAYGVELLSQSDMFATEPEGRVIRAASMPVPENHRIHRWQILIAGAGTLGETELYGRSVLSDSRLENKYIGPDAVALTFQTPGSDLNLYTFAFLSTKAGMKCVRSTSYGTKILRFRMDLLKGIPVPFKDDATTKRVADLIRDAARQREVSASHVLAARQPIESLPDVVVASDMCLDRRKRSLTWSGELRSLSAWNYASTGGALQHLAQKWKMRISDLADAGNCFYGPRFARISCRSPYGIDFLSQRDVFLVRSTARRILHPGCDDRLLFVPPNALLVAGQGQLEEGNLFGRVEIGQNGARECAVSEAVFRILPLDGTSEYLYAFLSTKLGGALIRGSAVGTSVPKINPDLLSRLPIPEISHELNTVVRNNIRKAIAARKRADESESEAVRILEEEVLPEWLA